MVTLVTDGRAGLVSLTGDPREQGLTHGRQAAGAIRANLDIVRKGMDRLQRSGRTYDYARVLARNEAFAQREAPELLQEIHGIADGADVPYEDLLLLNLPLYMVGNLMPLDCTQILVGGPATRDGSTLVAKTRDVAHDDLRGVVLHRRYPDGRELVEVDVAGSITWPGSALNGAGLTIATSGVWSNRTPIDLERDGWMLVNVHLLVRDSSSVDELAERLAEQPRITGMNIVAADARGTHAALEATADEVHRHDSSDGVVVRTNHYLTPSIAHLGPSKVEHPSSHHRHGLALERIQQQYGGWDAERLWSLVADHEGYPQLSICRHSVEGDGSDTLYGSVANLNSGAFSAFLDHPCERHGDATARARQSAAIDTTVEIGAR